MKLKIDSTKGRGSQENLMQSQSARSMVPGLDLGAEYSKARFKNETLDAIQFNLWDIISHYVAGHNSYT